MSTTVLKVAPMQWADLKKLNDVEPINEGDLECLAEVREVLKRHGKRERFGVALLHKHFDMDDGEVLLEDSDEGTRELTIKPVKREAAGEAVPTIWMLMDGGNRAEQSCTSDKCITASTRSRADDETRAVQSCSSEKHAQRPARLRKMDDEIRAVQSCSSRDCRRA